MNHLPSDSELEKESGLGGGSFEKYRTLTIDNGIDLQGTGATGGFVEKEYDEEKGEVIRNPFAPSEGFSGVIIRSRAVVNSKGRDKTWTTGEFNPLEPKALIPVYSLKDGKFIRDPQTNQPKIYYGTYDQLKKSQSTRQPDGSTQRSYEFYYILYVLTGGDEDPEVLKIKFKGSGRGHFIKYSQKLAGQNWKLFQVYTHFYIKKDPEAQNKYSIYFKALEDDNGNIKKYENDVQVREEMKTLYAQEKEKLDRLPAPKGVIEGGAHQPQAQQHQPQPQAQPQQPQAQPQQIIIDDEENVDPNEIKLEDIPF